MNQQQNELDGQLFEACWDDDLDLAKQAIQNGADVESMETDDHLDIRHSTKPAKKGIYLDIIKYLLTSCNANVEALDEDGWTPLHYACEEGFLDIVQYLLTNHDANLEATTTIVGNDRERGGVRYMMNCLSCDQPSSSPKTPFDFANARGHTNVTQLLLQAYRDKVLEREGCHSLHTLLHAASRCYAEFPSQQQIFFPLGELTVDNFRSLVESFPAHQTRIQDNNGALPLHIAVQTGAPVEIVRLLVEQDARAVRTPTLDGTLPLHLLCQTNNPSLDVVHYLLKVYQAAVSVETHDGDVPFWLACQASASVDVLFLLLTAHPGALTQV